MRTTLIASLILLTVTAVPAVAQQPISCPNDEDDFETFVPDYSRYGESGVFRVSHRYEYSEPEDVENFTLTIRATDGTAQTIPVELGYYGNAKLILQVPSAGPKYTVAFDWDQGVGTQSACHGNDTFTVPLIPAEGSVGDPGAPRFSGAFRVRSTPLNYDGDRDKVRWTLRPVCDFFGCDTRVKSTGGLSGLLRLKKDGTFFRRTVQLKARGWCEVTWQRRSLFTGQVIKRWTVRVDPAYRITRVRSFEVQTDDAGRVISFEGTDTTYFKRTPRAERNECRVVRPEKDAVEGSFIG